MIPMYYIYDTAYAPEELVSKYPNAAQYLTSTLFVEGAKEPVAVVDLANMGFNHPYVEGETGLTVEQLDAMVDSLYAPDPPPTGAEVQISKAQANYLYETRFKIVQEPESI